MSAADLALEHLAADEAALLEQYVDLAGERDAYRMAYLASVVKLHELHVELRSVREQHYRLVDEYRAYRATTIGTTERAA